MIARLTALALTLVLAAIGVSSIFLALRGAPAVDATARATGVFGDWRVPVSEALYLAPDYLFQLGYGYLQADAVASAATEGPEELAPAALITERALMAQVLLEDSLRYAPASAQTWASLAWAHAFLGDIEEARRALTVSWELAPYSAALAPQRLALADILSAAHRPELDAEVWGAAINNDRRILQRFGSRAVKNLLVDR